MQNSSRYLIANTPFSTVPAGIHPIVSKVTKRTALEGIQEKIFGQ
jgi:hypothetical protein